MIQDQKINEQSFINKCGKLYPDSKWKDITTVYCNDKKLRTLKGIENFTILRYLDCSNNDFRSYRGNGDFVYQYISQFKKLTTLYCVNSGLTKSQKEKIRSLNIKDLKIDD